MSSSSNRKSISVIVRIVVLTVIVLTALLSGVACNEGREGDRCNPVSAANGEDECGSGLSCQTLSVCMESYCCPSNPATSTNGYCNGTLWCPQQATQQDAGTD